MIIFWERNIKNMPNGLVEDKNAIIEQNGSF